MGRGSQRPKQRWPRSRGPFAEAKAQIEILKKVLTLEEENVGLAAVF
jgi:hypothetical protein